MTIQLDENIVNTCKNSSKANGFKTEIPEKHYKADRTLRVRITDRNAENLYLCGFPAFALSNGSSLALFVGGVMEIE